MQVPRVELARGRQERQRRWCGIDCCKELYVKMLRLEELCARVDEIAV